MRTATQQLATSAGPQLWSRRIGTFRELQDLKRQQPAHLEWSVSSKLFREAWLRLINGEDVHEVAFDTTAAAITNVLFPGCDEHFWASAGIDNASTEKLLQQALETTAASYAGTHTFEQLREATKRLAQAYHVVPVQQAAPGVLPPSIEALCKQARAGATRPGYARLVLVPPEMHSDHCLLTAVYAVLSAEAYQAEPADAFLCGLAHHLHNALLPDCGFAGEILLGDHLEGVIATGRSKALAELPSGLRQNTSRVLQYHETIAAPVGKAISAGDVLDRVLDVKWRTRAAAVCDADILGDMDLVHAGPLREFQADLLAQTGLWSL